MEEQEDFMNFSRLGECKELITQKLKYYYSNGIYTRIICTKTIASVHEVIREHNIANKLLGKKTHIFLIVTKKEKFTFSVLLYTKGVNMTADFDIRIWIREYKLKKLLT